MNIPAGEKVPESGNYGCTNCIVASALSGLFAAISSSGGASSEKIEGRTIRYFEKGSVFSECPNCGHLTGWCVTDKKPSEATAPTALQGALSRVMQGSSQCDVCGDTVDVGTIKIVEPALLGVATKSGYVPSRLPASWRPQCDMLGVSVASHWATVVNMNSSDDWKLCNQCLEELGRFKSKVPGSTTASDGDILAMASAYCARICVKEGANSKLSIGGKQLVVSQLPALFQDVAETHCLLTKGAFNNLLMKALDLLQDNVSKDDMMVGIIKAFEIVAKPPLPKASSRREPEPAPAKKAWWRFW